MMSWLLETGKGEAATSAFGTKIDPYPRSCYITSEEGLCGVRQTGVFIAFGMRVHLSSHKYPFNIQKRNLNETVLDSELQEV